MMIEPVFSDFANLWVALCPASALRADRPLAMTLAGERLVLFRGLGGGASALVDRCPHRGVALSLGRLAGGELACPFHGWRFAGDGRCTRVPWNPEAKRDTLSATTLPLREIGGVIWLFTGREAQGEPAVPPAFLRADVRLTAQDFVWDVHWTRAMENMLDTPHLPFVHARTIGKRLRGRTDEPMEMLWRETGHGAQIIAQRAGEIPSSALHYHFPNMMELTIDPGGRVMRLMAVCSPAEAGKTRLTIYTLRNFAKARLFNPLFARANARIAAEDRAIVESSRPRQVPPAGEENSVPTDAPTLAFRKIWFTRIRDQERG